MANIEEEVKKRVNQGHPFRSKATSGTLKPKTAGTNGYAQQR